MKYLLDSNVFIEAKNRYYGFDLCPGFWAWIDREHQAKNVFSVESVLDEVRAGSDELSEWVRSRTGLFLRPGGETLESMRAVSNWANGAGYETGAVSRFLDVADYYLVAQAHALDVAVVTHELPSDSLKKIKIPNVCAGLGVRCLNPFSMLKLEKAKFVLGSD